MPGQLIIRDVISDKLAMIGLVVIIALAVWFGIKLGESSKKRRKDMVSEFSDTAFSSNTSSMSPAERTDYVRYSETIRRSDGKMGTFDKILALAVGELFKPSAQTNLMTSVMTRRNDHGFHGQMTPYHSPVVELIDNDKVVETIKGKLI